MPVITVDGPSIDVKTKRKLVSELSEVAADLYGIPDITVLIKENEPENVGVNGTLIADRKEASES